MDARTDVLAQLSQGLASRAEKARISIAAVRAGQWMLSGIVWREDVIVSSAQALPRCHKYGVVSASGEDREAILIGSDPATNIVALRCSRPLQAQALVGRVPTLGELALAYGVDYLGSTTARLGTICAVGDSWHSRKGGQIDHRLALDVRLSRSEEGGPIFDVDGGFIGMSTFGPARRVIAIPASTLERVVPALLKDGEIAHGWLGIALHPVEVPEAQRDASGQSAALMAMSVMPNGPAAKAGVLVGDIVLSIDGHPTERIRSLVATLGPDSIGRRIELRVIRGGAIQVVPLTVESRPRG
jgi:S1-C subfamily serine protease